MKKLILITSLMVSTFLISACADTTPQTVQWQPHTTGHVSAEVARMGP